MSNSALYWLMETNCLISRRVKTIIAWDSDAPTVVISLRGRMRMIGKLTMTLHDAKEFDNDLGRGTNKNLTLSTALSVDNIVKTVILTSSLWYRTRDGTQTTHQDGYADHFLRCRGWEEGQRRLDMEKSKQWIYGPSLSVVLRKARVKQGEREVSMVYRSLGQPLQTGGENSESFTLQWLD